MLNDIVNEFLKSNEGNQCVQSITQQHNLDRSKAENAIRTTAEAGADAVKAKGLDVNKILGGMMGGGGGGGGGLPNDVVSNVADRVCKAIGVPQQVGTAIVQMVLPKLMQFAKGRGAPV